MKIFNGITLVLNGKCYKFFDRSGTEYRVVFDKTTGELVKWTHMTKQWREERGIIVDVSTGAYSKRGFQEGEKRMKVFVIEYIGGRGIIRVYKNTKEEAVEWFKEWYPNREITSVYEQQEGEQEHEQSRIHYMES